MARAAGLRLREALAEFIAEFTGDTGTRRGSLRSAIPEDDREMVTAAQKLLGMVDGGSSTGADVRETAGSRARDRASQQHMPTRGGDQDTVSRAARTRAVEMMGGATNRSGGNAPDGGTTSEGGTP